MPGTRKLGRSTDHRKAMMRAMVTYLLENGRIETTVTRAKEVRAMTEKMITLAKVDSLHNKRQALAYITKEDVVNKLFNEIAPKFEEADGLVVASPVYYASANATLVACLDRLFYSTGFDKTMKVGASVVVARRGGCSATFDELNKYFTISGMPVASSQYWNSVHGRMKGEAAHDHEGMQTVRVLARNMSFLMKSIALGKEKFGLPETEEWQATNFIS